MNVSVRLFFIGLICVLWLAPAVPAVAPAGPVITTLKVDIWPEHDDPRVLIIYRGTLSDEAPLPYTLQLSIPAAAQVHATAYRRNGELFTARYQATPAGDQTKIMYSVPERDFQFEYYVDLLSGPPQRTFAVSLMFPLPVGDLQVSVEQPLRSSGFALTPAAARTVASGGFTYYVYAEQRWPAGRLWAVRGSYRKEDTTPSITQAPQPTPPPPAPSPQSFSFSWVLPMVAGVILGVAGVLIVVFVLQSTRRRRTVIVAPRRGRGPRHDDVGGERRYCAHCGRRAGPRDRFCSNCGRPLPEA